MKKLRINVNGRIYDVVVEVLEDDEQNVTGANDPLPAARPPVKRQAAPAAAAPAPMPQVSAAARDPNTIAAPIAGTVQKLFVQAGAKVEAKTPVVLLDAMKMDTYIYAPRSGEVAEVSVTVGQTVQVGDLLIRYKPE